MSASMHVTCPHGDPLCPCQDGDSCHYEGLDPVICPNPPNGWKGLTFAHCHMEGCTWMVDDRAQMRVKGECGLMKLGLHPAGEVDGKPFWSMAQARPGKVGWPCGWLRTPLNVSSKALGEA